MYKSSKILFKNLRHKSVLRDCIRVCWFLLFLICFLPVFLTICSILELEAAISTVRATFWNWNFSFSMCTILVEFVRAAVSTVFAALVSSNISFSVLELV